MKIVKANQKACKYYIPKQKNFNEGVGVFYKQFLSDGDFEEINGKNEWIIFYKRDLQNVLSIRDLKKLSKILLQKAYPKIQELNCG